MVGYCWYVYARAGDNHTLSESTFYRFQKRNRISLTDIRKLSEDIREESGLSNAFIVSMISLGRMTKARFDALEGEENK